MGVDVCQHLTRSVVCPVTDDRQCFVARDFADGHSKYAHCRYRRGARSCTTPGSGIASSASVARRLTTLWLACPGVAVAFVTPTMAASLMVRLTDYQRVRVRMARAN